MKIITLKFILAMLLLSSAPGFSQFFSPWILHKPSDFARMREKIALQKEPWFTAWNSLRNSSEAQLSWNPRATQRVIRGGTGDNISLMYRDVAAAYAHALIYNINGDTRHGDKAAQILNSWSSINQSVSGNADRYLAAGLNGYQFAIAADLMKDYPAFDFPRFKEYLMNVFYYPLNERFLIGNHFGAPHNDACTTNYRVNWDACNMNAMLAISILCNHKAGFDKVLNYAKNGAGNGNITRAVNFIHSPIWGQWEESGRDQGHTMGGLMLYGIFCEILWNQGVDFYGYDDSRFRKGAEYVARYNIMENGVGRYNDLPYTSYSRRMGSNCSWHTESVLSPAVRGKRGSHWEMIYNHYARRINDGVKVRSIFEILQQQPSIHVPSMAAHPDTYDHPAVATLTHRVDSGSYILPWDFMDVMPRTILRQAHYGRTSKQGDTITLKASGNGIISNIDNFHFAFQRLIDNGSIEARIMSIDELNDKCQAGIMMREELQQQSAFVMLTISAVRGLEFSARNKTGDQTTVIKSDTQINTFPLWLKITRDINEFKAMTSADGQVWKEFGSVQMDFKRDLKVGLAASSGNHAMLTTAVFANAQISQENMLPVVNLTSRRLSDISYIDPANISVQAFVYDIDGEIAKTEIIVNDSLYHTSNLSNVNYMLKAIAAGEYRLVVKTYDNDGAIGVSDTTLIIVTEPTNRLPWYKFDETRTGFFSTDASGNNLIATTHGGPTYVEGRVNNAIRLDGVDDYVKLPATFIHRLSDFTISSWINPEALSNWMRIFDFGSGTNNYMMLTVDNGTGITFDVVVNGARQRVSTSRKLTLNQWSFLTITMSNDILTMYLNGSFIGRNVNFTFRPYDLGPVSENFIGKSQWPSDPFFRGMIDEFRFFNRALSVAEINSLMLGTTSVKDSQLSGIKIYPNPARGLLHVSNAASGMLSIMDATGRYVINSRIDENNHTLNLADLSPGYYIVRITIHGEQPIQQKLIIR